MANTAKRVALYAAVGPELTHYEVDVDAATLTRRTTIELPANIHYCWPHASKPILYAATSDSASGVGGFVGSNHHVSALTLDRATGAPSKHGAPISLPTRPIHMTTDNPSEHILVAFSNPSGVRRCGKPRTSTPAFMRIRSASGSTTARPSWWRAATTLPATSPRSRAPCWYSITGEAS